MPGPGCTRTATRPLLPPAWRARNLLRALRLRLVASVAALVTVFRSEELLLLGVPSLKLLATAALRQHLEDSLVAVEKALGGTRQRGCAG